VSKTYKRVPGTAKMTVSALASTLEKADELETIRARASITPTRVCLHLLNLLPSVSHIFFHIFNIIYMRIVKHKTNILLFVPSQYAHHKLAKTQER
jgi:hypothetical protein